MWRRTPTALALALALAAFAAPVLAEDLAKPLELVETTSQAPDTSDDSTPADEDADPAASLLHAVKKALDKQLHRENAQLFNAVVAFGFGITMVVDGNIVFKWFVVAAVFAAVTLLAHNEADNHWPADDQKWLRRFVSGEAGLVAAAVAAQGFEGLVVMLGAMFGAAIAYGLQTSFQALFQLDTTQYPVWVVVAVYTLIMLFFTAAVAKKRHLRFLGIVSSFLGGALTASSVAWFATTYIAQNNVKVAFHGADLEVVRGAWIDFLLLMLGLPSQGRSDVRDVGLFANVPGEVNQYSDHGWPADRICGCALWFVLFAGGSCVQSRRQRRLTKARELEANQEPLLPK